MHVENVESGRKRPQQRWRNCAAKVVVSVACALAWSFAASSPVRASTAYGDLNNFDVFNDTGQDCHGFEIELDDVHSTAITYTFDWNHYGTPTITEDNTDPAHPKVLVRYAAKYSAGSFTAYTAVPASPPAPTDGHMCTNPAVNIGCEHFGVGYYGTPTLVTYHWLIEDPFAPGNLKLGPAVNVATPSWNYAPPAGGQVAQVQAVILAPPPPPAPVYEFGDATWVKAIVTTSHNNARVELKDLVSDDPADPNDKNWANGEPDEVEVEWQILQTEFNNPNGANNDLAGAPEDLPHGDEVVTRRYEFYKYSGPFDAESHEAICTQYPQISDPANPKYKAACDPAALSVVGDYIGAQMAGFNVEAVFGLIDHVQDGELDQPYTDRTVVVGGNTPYFATISAGALPAGLNLDSASGVLSGTPTAAGVFSFTVSASDADLVQVSKAYTLQIGGALGSPCDGVVCVASDACHEAGVCDPASGVCSDPVVPDGMACDDSNACTQSDSCHAGVCLGNNPVTCVAADACHVAGTCDPASGVCSDPVAADGTVCNDSDACTQSDSCQAGVCSGANPILCTASDACHVAGTCDSATGICSNPIAADGTACNDGDGCAADVCAAGACQAASCPTVDVALLSRSPLNGTIAKGKTAVLKALALTVRNADSVDHEIALSVDGGDCPAGMAPTLDFDSTTPAADSSAVVGAGKTKKAKLSVTLRSSDFDSLNGRAPARCTLRVKAAALIAGGSNDVNPSNNTALIEINVIDKNDAASPAATHETVVGSAKPIKLVIAAGAASAHKTLIAKVINADGPPPMEQPGDVIRLSASTSCPGLSLTPPVCEPSTSSNAVTVKSGGTRTCKMTATADASQIATANKLSPQRCIVTLTASGPSDPQLPPLDASNNQTQLVVDVIDAND